MSTSQGDPQAQANEKEVEGALAKLLKPLDVAFERANKVTNITTLSLPAPFLVLWQAVGQGWKISVVETAALGAAVFVVSFLLKQQALAQAIADFGARFPADNPARELALRILPEMQSPSKAEQKLHESLLSRPENRVISRKKAAPKEEEEGRIVRKKPS